MKQQSRDILDLNPDWFDARAQRHLEKVHELLSGATPMGAYCLGLLSAHAFKHGVDIPDAILEGSSKVTSFAIALEHAGTIWEFGRGAEGFARIASSKAKRGGKRTNKAGV
jgi:hypothetical protein